MLGRHIRNIIIVMFLALGLKFLQTNIDFIYLRNFFFSKDIIKSSDNQNKIEQTDTIITNKETNVDNVITNEVVIDATAAQPLVDNFVLGIIIATVVIISCLGIFFILTKSQVVGESDVDGVISPELVIIIKSKVNNILEAISTGPMAQQINNMVTLIENVNTKTETLLIIRDYIHQQLPLIVDNPELLDSYTQILECLNIILLG